MKPLGHIFSVIAMLLLGYAPSQAVSPFSAMSVEEVSTLLSQAETAATAASAKDAAIPAASDIVPLPVTLTASDMISKIYGVVDPEVSRQECIDQSRRTLRLTPEEDNGVLWLESDGGYRVNYYGLLPDVSAMARFDNDIDGVNDYGYFFLFPYLANDKRESITRQADFCGTLLQEMADLGLPMDLNTATDDLFEAVGDYNGNFIDVRLLDDKGDNGEGRFILILSVEPNAFTQADNTAAL